MEGLVNIVTQPHPREIKLLRNFIKQHLQKGLSWTEIKKLGRQGSGKMKIGKAERLKRSLDWFLVSGICPIHHNDKTLQYNGAIQIDIDFKFDGGDLLALQIKQQLAGTEFDCIPFAALSPSGYGVKAIVATNNFHKKHHNTAARQVIKFLSTSLDIDPDHFDPLGASQPCYIPYDDNPFYNIHYSLFDFKPNAQLQQPTAATIQSQLFLPVSTKAIDAAIEYAHHKGFEFRDGQKHLFLTHFCIACNLFGIPKQQAENYIHQHYISKNEQGSNFLGPFTRYAQSFGKWKYKIIQKPSATVIQGKQGDYVSNLVSWQQVQNTICVSPTGSGKTTFFVKIPGRKIVCCPVLSLVKNIVTQFRHLGATEFSGEFKNYHELKSSNLIVTTFASFESLTLTLANNLKAFHLIVDEIHATTTNGHQLKDLAKIINKADQFNSFTGFTGTDIPNAHPVLIQKKRLIINIPRYPATYEILEVDNTLKAAAVLFKKAIRQNKIPLLLQNQTNQSKNRLTLQQYINRNDIFYFDSQSKKDNAYIDFVSSGEIPQQIKGIVFTTVIEVGLSIKTTGHYLFIILGNFHPITIEQVRKRTRKESSNHICIVRSNQRQKSNAGFNFRSIMAEILRVSQRQCDSLNMLSDLTFTVAIREAIAREAIQKLPISFNTETKKYETDLLRASYYTFRLETIVINRNDDLMEKHFKQYNILKSDSNTTIQHQTPTPDEVKRAKQSHARLDSKNQSEYQDNIAKLEKTSDILSYCSEALYLHSSKLSKTEKHIFNAVIKLSEYTSYEKQVLHWLKRYPKESQKKLLIGRLNIRAITNNPNHMNKNTLFVIFCRAMQNAFKPGELLPSNIIRQRVIACLRLDKTFFISRYKNDKRITKVLNIARLFFEMEPKQLKISQVKITSYQVGTLNLSFIITHPPVKGTDQLIDLSVKNALKTLFS